VREAVSGAGILHYEPDARGGRCAREAVAGYLGRRVVPEDLVLAASTSEAYAWLFKLLGDPGDEVLVPSPSYPLFPWLARLEGLEAVPVPAFWHEGWHLDPIALEEACGPRTRAIIVVGPNNPTGQFLKPAEWQALVDLAVRRDLALLVDEVFADYPVEPTGDHLATVLDTPEPACPVFVLSGLSKIAALPQIKLGWIAAHGAPAREALGALTFIADQYLSVSASAQAAAPALLAASPDLQHQLRDRLKTNLDLLDTWLQAHPHLGRLRVEGGWSVILRRPAIGEDETCASALVRDHGVLVHPGSFFDLPREGHLVLSLLPEPATFREGLERLGQGLTLAP